MESQAETKNVLKHVGTATATCFNGFYVSAAGLQPAAMAVYVLRLSIAEFTTFGGQNAQGLVITEKSRCLET